jgi:hypothetical protein
MAETVAREFVQFTAAERRAQRLPAAPRAIREGEVWEPVFIERGKLAEFARVAARRASGLVRPSARHEVVWVDGASELAVDLAKIDVRSDNGVVRVQLPVRCDQTGAVAIEVLFAVGSPDEPAGLYAAASRRPDGPALIVDAWGEALVALAWQCMLGIATGIAAASGKDARGNLLVPVEFAASARGIQIVPMARHRFAGSSTLKQPIRPVR